MRLANLPWTLFTGILLAANSAATPITFQMTLPNATGVNNLVSFTKQTVVVTVQADTSQVVPVASISDGAAGNCVPAISTSIAVGGGAALQAVAPTYFCSTLDTTYVGIFTTSDAAPFTWYFLADYSGAGIANYALASSFPLTPNVFGRASPTTARLNLAGGGTAALTGVSFFAENTFMATLPAISIPTLSWAGLASLAALLAFAGGVTLTRRMRA